MPGGKHGLRDRPAHGAIVNGDRRGSPEGSRSAVDRGEHQRNLHVFQHLGPIINPTADKDEAADSRLLRHMKRRQKLIVRFINIFCEHVVGKGFRVLQNRLGKGAEKRIGPSADDQTDGVPGLLETAGIPVADEMAFRNHALDDLPGLLIHIRAMIENAADRGDGYTGEPCNIPDGISAHRITFPVS